MYIYIYIDIFIKLLGCWDVGLVLSENSIQVVLGSSPSAQDNYLKAVGRVLSGDGPVDKHKAAQADTKSLTDFTAEICIWIIWHIKRYIYIYNIYIKIIRIDQRCSDPVSLRSASALFGTHLQGGCEP